MSYELSPGGYGQNIQFSIVHCGHVGALFIVSSVKYLRKH
jgi:hypothetical protein